MTSYSSSSNGFVYGSAASSYSVRDVIASYRRAQYLVTSSNVASSVSDLSSGPLEDKDDFNEDSRSIDDLEAALPDHSPLIRPDRSEDGRFDDLQWDEDELPTPGPSRFQRTGGDPGIMLPAPEAPGDRILDLPALRSSPSPPARRPSETTPLIRKKISFHEPPHPPHAPAAHPHLARRVSSSSIKPVHGGSTFGQTLFNSIAILLGIGMLSEPLAFACAGWAWGSVLLVFYGGLSCYTAKILGKIILGDPRLRSYSDIARKAFGPRSTPFVSTLFVLELFAVSVALVTLYADSLHSIMPQYSADAYKIWAALLLIPTVFMPLSLLSFTSFIGILSTVFIVVVIFVDGLSKKEAPGSLWSPAETSITPGNLGELGISFGLFMAGFSGHAVIPSLAKDMADPTQFDKMIDWAFIVATSIYFLIGAAGYVMFGHNVDDEVSQNLLSTPGYNATLNQVALWTLVISPLSKYALTTRPVNMTLEIILGLETYAADEHELKATTTMTARPSSPRWKQFLIAVERTAFTLASIAVSILVPEFSSMMAFLGSFSAFVLCVIGPISAKVALARRCGLVDGAILVVAVMMAAWGTGAAFWSTT